MSGADEARREAALRQGMSDTVLGYCETIDWATGLVKVRIGGAAQLMGWVGEPPWPGNKLRVTYAGRKPYCEVVYPAVQGTVQSVTANIATVRGDDEETSVYPISVSVGTLSTGDRVRLDHAGRLVVHVYPAEPDEVILTPPPPPPVPTGGAQTFRPVDSGNYRSGVYQGPLVEISVTRSGHYWYGTQIADTIPDSATIRRAEIFLSETWDNVPGTASHMGTHTQAYRGGEPGLSGSIDVFGSGAIPLGGFADALKTGGAMGIGFYVNTGWRQFDTAAASGSIYMEWS